MNLGDISVRTAPRMERLKKHIGAFGDVKPFAINEGVSHTRICLLVKKLGFVRAWVTKEECAHLKTRRGITQ